MAKRQVQDMSGFCRHSGFHEMCHVVWETPSAIVTCSCTCHTSRVPSPLTPKGPGVRTGGMNMSMDRVIVPKR